MVTGALGVAALAALWMAPAGVTAATQQAAAQAPQTQKKTTITVEAQSGDQPTVTMRKRIGNVGFATVLDGGDGPRLGIQIRDVDKDEVAKLKLPVQSGAVVADVSKESAAEKAGLKANDVVVQFDGETVRSARQLTRLVQESVSGRAVKLAVMREGKRLDLDVTPTEASEEVRVFVNGDQIRGDVEREIQNLRGKLQEYQFQRPGPGEPARQFLFRNDENGPFKMMMTQGRGRLGVTVQDLSPELATYFGVKGGVLVASVQADSPAAKAGVKAGDVITAVGDKTVTSPDELVTTLDDKQGEVTIGLTRDKKPMTLKATIDAPKEPGRRIVLQG